MPLIILENPYIEEFIKFLKKVNENHWILVEWYPLPELRLHSSICPITKEHLQIFQNWVIENDEFIWTDQSNEKLQNFYYDRFNKEELILTGADILSQLVFYYDDNMISLYQKLHERKQFHKNNISSTYTFLSFVTEICENADSDEKKEDVASDEDADVASLDDDYDYVNADDQLNEYITQCVEPINIEEYNKCNVKPFIFSNK